MRLGRIAKQANEQSISALEPLHTNLALSPVRLHHPLVSFLPDALWLFFTLSLRAHF